MVKLGVAIPTLLVLLVALVSLGEMRSMRCCTNYTKKPFPVRLMQNYFVQDFRGSCNIEAVIFITKLGKKICANPRNKWVQKAMDIIDSREA